MARPSRTGGKTSKAKARNTNPAKGRKTAKTKGSAAPTTIRLKRTTVLDLTRELKEAREQQAATSEVLEAINRSGFDLDEILQTLVSAAARLCKTGPADIFLLEGDVYRFRAGQNLTEAYREHEKRAEIRAGLGTLVGRVVLKKGVVHIADALEDIDYEDKGAASANNFRSMLGVPLLRNGEPVGVFALARTRVEPFGESQIRLVSTFASQAVIAIENARLFNETQEALERQTATADILKVIASSPSDTTPVFEAIATSAKRLLGGFSTAVFRFLDGKVHLAAFTPTHQAADDALRADFPQPVENFEAFRLAQDGKPFPIPDTEKVPHAPLTKIARLHGFRSMLWVPMVSGDITIGIISVTRAEPGAFAPNHVQLLQTFADQAVIAIENTRLFNETQEALERQTATAEILNVIARSPSDVQPVFDAIAASGHRLLGGLSTSVMSIVDDMLHLSAFTPTNPSADAALQALFPRPLSREIWNARIRNGETVEIPDVETDPMVPEGLREMWRKRGFRSLLLVPLVRSQTTIGMINTTRMQPGPFAAHHVQLLQTFADQAVIAIENVRLFNETREALERQTATSEVLEVISSSPGDLQPVFKAMLNNALRICEAKFGQLLLFDGTGFLAADLHNSPADYGNLFKEGPLIPGPNTGLGRLIATKTAVHIHDVVSGSLYAERDPLRIATVDILQARTLLAVPMLKDAELVGAVIIYRQEVRPFSDRQIELVTNFAAQGVIALENTRLLKELRGRTDDLTEALQQQSATADVLKVISRSAFDLQTVLETLVTSAATLCDAERGLIFLRQENQFNMAANYGFSPELEAFARAHPLPADGSSTTARAAASGVAVQAVDLLADETQGEMARKYQRLGGHRTNLGVPLRLKDEIIGVFTLTRQVVRPFTDKQIELVSTFADQAVIAIENVRLFDEVQARTRDLSESLEHQTAISDILRVISSSPGNVQPVLATVAQHAAQICEAKIVDILTVEDDKLRYAAELGDFGRILYGETAPLNRETVMGRSVCDRQPVHVVDLQSMDHDFPLGREYALALGHRTTLAVPLIREDRALGTILVRRAEVRPFDDRHITLLKTFADQAAIAIVNARLFNDVQDRTRELSQSLDELRTAQDRLIQTEKLASLGQLTAGIAHEIKNPLNFVNNFSALSAELTGELNDVLKPVVMDDKVRAEVAELTGLLKDNLEKVVQHGKRADSIVKNMLLHSREGSGEHRPADINSLLDESLNLAYHGARAEKGEFNITLQRDFDTDAGTIELFPQEITRAFLNLIANGVYAATRRRTEEKEPGFEPTLRATTKNLGNTVEIRIRDNGSGIPAEVQEKMFNPFFTTKPAGEGTGLGLSMTHDIIVKQHNGRIDVETEPGIFTEFIIILPRAITPPKTAGGTN